MKNKQTALKALLVAGILGTMMEANVATARIRGTPPPPAAPANTIAVANLTDAQIAALTSTDPATLSAAANGMLAGVTGAARVALAQSIAAYVARTKTPAAAGAVLTGLVAQVPAAATSILMVALAITPSLNTTLAAVLPVAAQASLSTAVASAATAVQAGAATVVTFTNPLTNSAS